ncbi:hypothetical protein Peur_028531 [Populus x canadensis]
MIMKGQEDENSWDFPSVFVAEGIKGWIWTAVPGKLLNDDEMHVKCQQEKGCLVSLSSSSTDIITLSAFFMSQLNE